MTTSEKLKKLVERFGAERVAVEINRHYTTVYKWIRTDCAFMNSTSAASINQAYEKMKAAEMQKLALENMGIKHKKAEEASKASPAMKQPGGVYCPRCRKAVQMFSLMVQDGVLLMLAGTCEDCKIRFEAKEEENEKDNTGR